jgi:hypothetical protein
MIFSDPIAKLSFAMIENYYMLIRPWIQDTLTANIFTIASSQDSLDMQDTNSYSLTMNRQCLIKEALRFYLFF